MAADSSPGLATLDQTTLDTCSHDQVMHGQRLGSPSTSRPRGPTGTRWHDFEVGKPFPEPRLPRQSFYPSTPGQEAIGEPPTGIASTRKRRLDIPVKDSTDSNLAPHSKRQRIAAVSPPRASATTARHCSRESYADSSCHKVSANTEQHEQGSDIEQGDPAQQEDSSTGCKRRNESDGRGHCAEADRDSDQANRKLEERSAPAVTPANPTLPSNNVNFRNQRPKTAEDQKKVAEAMWYTYKDLADRRPEFKNKKNLNMEKDNKTGREYDTCLESYGYQWNRLQVMFQEALDNDAGLDLGSTKSGRKSKKRKQAEANRVYLVEVDGQWLTGFDDWKPPDTSKQREDERKNGRKELQRQGSCAEPIEL